MQYKHLFFDLDHTIWDFDKNAEETLNELYHTYKLMDLGLHSPDRFIEVYTHNNHQLWAEYHVGKITKQKLRETRFSKTFIDLGLSPNLIPQQFEDDYVNICPTKTNLFPKAHETLSYLKERYTLHLISNGFKESTELKVSNNGLNVYFENVVISEVVGFNKPDKAIFNHALTLANAGISESIMIGDSLEADIRGAQDYGMKAIYFNPERKEIPEDVDQEIACLSELMTIL
ncbi:MAG: noncanonical pyrimidine nucleotidase, YjjG family [Sphingobacteriales bacterium 17-39-43]|uniref:YjjG family noncanonical pyrimidine nucleotidase n=1 Tax=Daejeonella sp. TaxID=2805397 RepID=UPI000BC73ED4|nr:YjjG family noncanonical pyrimidine nucleotidase [Daejeonella sp.]OYZ27865.1 MAG: noncanonical pyrimidine nucleotidase, YjjG family [Sphingobacteriales bacterium 16-39-50]OZA21928.1 MAG: noncanonical pyrimidine nucleotidase, YjjG family [Sphingobacteriales bacterium 17-39-43]HQT59532.1 YjjG family noncanonical pyrimidine nucleotidase [Daejeonella sp.]